jgi:Na+/H+ antiporter NhaD/arsenite permease-like protein
VLPVLVVFALSYVLIAGRRLSLLPIGRPAGAMLGASAMVLLSLVHPSGLAPEEAFRAIEPHTIALLLGMMLLAGALAEDAVFEWGASWLERVARTPARLLWAVVLGSGVLSALLLNDSVCLLLAPLVVALVERNRLPRVPFLLALAMGSNAGSAMTLAGNPQNMLVAQLSGLSYVGYLRVGAPAGLLALGVTGLLLQRALRRELGDAPAELVRDRQTNVRLSRHAALTLLSLFGVSLGFALGGSLAWTALIGASLAIAVRGRDPSPVFARVSWTVLVFFCGLFVLMGALQKAGVPGALVRLLSPHLPEGEVPTLVALSGAMLVGCQLVSNVPFILLVEPLVRSLPNQTLAWSVVAVVTTLAGNLTLLGSVANVIVVEAAGAERELGFRRYLWAGLPVTLASTAVALAWLLVVAR